MKKRIYLGEWLLNVGIIGFLRILKQADINIKPMMHQNYIEFDTEVLQDFSDYYFSYFLKQYNIAEEMKRRIENLLDIIQSEFSNHIELPKTKEEKEKNKQIEDKIKKEIGYIKNNVKTQMDKIKKFDISSYEKILEGYNQITNIKTQEQLDFVVKVSEEILEEIAQESINTKITTNLFKNILTKQFFGQPRIFKCSKNRAIL